MAKNRRASEKSIIDAVNAIDPSGNNGKIYEKRFKEMTNKEFDDMIELFRSGKSFVNIFDPNGAKKTKITLSNNKRLLKKLGIKLYQRIDITDESGKVYSPPHTYNIMPLVVTRLGQHQSTGIGVPKNNLKRNPITNQVTNESKAGSITLPEMYIYNGLGLENILTELLGPRGGDLRSLRLMEASLEETGTYSMEDTGARHGVPGATTALKNYFKALHMEFK